MEVQSLSPSNDHTLYFERFIKLLADKFQPLQIYCFAKPASADEIQDCYSDQLIKFKRNYCLLLVTENSTRIDYEVQDFSNFHYGQGNITVLCHGKESILDAIKANNKFFMTVCNSELLIYSHDEITVQDYSSSFIPTHAATKAIKHFKHRMLVAEGFLNGANECLSKEQFTVSTFMLHQVVEQCCISLIRVHLAYRSEMHNLKRMLGLCRAFSEKPYGIFLSGNPEDQRLFELLLKSYSGARYTPTFSVSEIDAILLRDKVYYFLNLTKAMCTEKIEKLEAEAVLYKKLRNKLIIGVIQAENV